MTREEFAINTKTLEEFYNKEFNYTQSDIWYDELKLFTAEKYERAVRQACKSLQYKPTLSQILDIIRTIKGTQEQESVKCNLCNGTGYLTYTKVIYGHEYEYACLCTCQNAKGKEYDGTKIADKEHRSQYYIAKAEDVFMKKIN